MKKFSILSLGLILTVIITGFLLIGCQPSKEKQTSDTIAKLPPTPFNLDNNEVLFAQVEAKIDSVIQNSGLYYQTHTITGYLTWDSITHAQYSPDLFSLSTESEWLRHNRGVIEYLNWHLRKAIYAIVDDPKIAGAMKAEAALTDTLLATQYKWLRSHFDTTQQDLGSANNGMYYQIEFEMLELQNKNMRELLEAMTDSNYNSIITHKITPTLFEKEYRHLQMERIPYYRNDSIYNADADRANLATEIAAWNQLMKQRDNVSAMLNGKNRHAFDIGTNRLMFNRLRQLKNEYEAYGSMSGDMRENVLSDSCTFEELIDYPNFSTKWNEYLKQFK